MAVTTAALTEPQSASDWAKAFTARLDAVCRHFWKRLENKNRPPALTPVKIKPRTLAPSHTQLDHSDALSPMQQWEKPETMQLQSLDSPPGPPQPYGTPQAGKAKGNPDQHGRDHRSSRHAGPLQQL
ncbi:Hypothetical predicted protein [Pelobates cultripes]|uniref:Uncharacterized protein n=1 Tax=Pelobates cultripes TaxID=61616 RepID=A0AAD1RPG5_PELCU|nr:Hypothetical predicted protein [Pelobates cultripes]